MGGGWLCRGLGRLTTVLVAGAVVVSLAPAAGASAPVGTPGMSLGAEGEALAEAERSGEPVEVSGLTSESSQTFAEPDGTFTTVESLRPVRVRDEAGEWVDADATLRVVPGGGLAPVAAVLDVVVSAGGEQPMVTLTGAGGRELEVDWPGPLPEPVVTATQATFPDVLPGVDLQVRVETDSVSHVLVVKTPEAAADPALDELALPVSGSGLSLRTDDQGGLTAVDDGAGGTVFAAAPPMMWDSTQAPSAASPLAGPGAELADSPGGASRVAPVAVEVSSSGDEVVLTPDQSLLEDAGTTYPVYIDPQWYTARDTEWGMVSSYHPNASFFKFSGNEGVGMCPYDYDFDDCNYRDVKRLFYQFPTSRFTGMSVIDAEFVVENTFSFNCTPQEVQLWRTRDVSAGTSWNRQNESGYWIDRLQTRNEAHGWGSDCPSGDIEFWAGRAVADAAAGGWSSITLGLRATVENAYTAWKRFDDSAYLRVNYNRPPAQPRIADLTMSPGGACVTGPDAASVNAMPRTYVEARDPDGDDIALQYRVAEWVNGSSQVLFTSGLSARKASGSTFTYDLPSWLPANRLLLWGVRVHDGAAWSPWSFDGAATACHFRYDPSAPAGPAIASAQYPESDPENAQDPWMNGVGRYGTFSIDSASSDVVRYTYGINRNPTTANTVTTSGGAARTINFMPTRVGVNFITAQAYDPAGNVSSVTTYRFRVRTGQPERAAFGMNENSDAHAVTGTGGTYEAALHGGASPGGDGATGTGLRLDGVDDLGRTPGGVVDTTAGFTVSLWARLPENKENRAMVAVSQTGAHQSAFELLHSSALGGWVFYRDTADTASAPPAVRAAQPPCPAGDTVCADSRLGEWTHVVGTMDHGLDEMRLYIDGQLAATATYTADWDSRASLLLGASANDSRPSNHFEGDLDDVRIWDIPLRAEQVAALHEDGAAAPGRPMKAAWDLDEPSDAVVVTGRGESVTATLHGDASPGAAGVEGTGLHLDGDDSYATAPRPVVNSYYSFSVSLWARLPADPDRAMTVLAQEATDNTAFAITHSPAQGGWGFSRATANTTGAASVAVTQEACTTQGAVCPGAGEWSHVVAVYDHAARTLALYVNGARVGSVPYNYNWTPNGPFYLGAGGKGGVTGAFFEGDLDEVRLYDRVISADEVQELFRRNPVLSGRWRLDTASGTPPVTSEAAGAGPGATLHGDAGFAPGIVGTGRALALDGAGDWADTPAAPFDSSGSWSVTAWVATPGRPQRNAAVLSLAGTRESALTLRYSPDPENPATAGRWQLEVADRDAAGAVRQVAEHTNYQLNRDWNHLAIVHDAFADRVSLYVDGQLSQVICGETADPGCTDVVSWRSSVLPFRASGGLQIGRTRTGGVWGEYWSGEIDDVWSFRGVLSDADIGALAAPERDEGPNVP
ncbi:LamG-like jellyroll fold domain-containing protein [Streptomyces sp. NPDC049881]|uniref:LamG-like jellyroll fold domain-containing protein n=1 Tax=Streptomyces sp. NPDC049881 TaxID=3155778 RepID=UPI0034147F2A